MYLQTRMSDEETAHLTESIAAAIEALPGVLSALIGEFDLEWDDIREATLVSALATVEGIPACQCLLVNGRSRGAVAVVPAEHFEPPRL